MGKRKSGSEQLVGGLIVLGIGVLFLLVNLDVIPNLGKMWPLFPIIVGLAMVIGSFRRSNSTSSSSSAASNSDGAHHPDSGSHRSITEPPRREP